MCMVNSDIVSLGTVSQPDDKIITDRVAYKQQK